jgi:predicted HTH transcriptional regulator
VRCTEDVLALSNQPLERRIRERENGLVERKSSFRYDRVMQGPSKKLEKEMSVAISGFMNVRGGILIIGVDPAGKSVGLSKDYSLVQNNNSDGFERELRNSIKKHLICEVIVKPSSKPIILFDGDKQEFYVRVGNSTKLYGASDMIAYCQKRF